MRALKTDLFLWLMPELVDIGGHKIRKVLYLALLFVSASHAHTTLKTKINQMKTMGKTLNRS